jgi:RNA polymerase subunit RPABC4/transcription elongation factor Spt4
MILIAGISPKTKVLDQNPRRCPICGLNQAYYKRVDHYLSLFFIPLLRVKKGDPFIICDRCNKTIPQSEPDILYQANYGMKTCPSCGRSLDLEFKYCPNCGQRIKP